MNNIYKVIWSKAKNCYVVASEIARSHTKSASGSTEKIGGVTRKALLALGTACAIVCGGFVNVGAATIHVDESATSTANAVYTTDEVYTKNEVNEKLKDVSTNAANISKLEDEKADKTELASKANTSLDNLSDAGKAVIKDTMSADMALKADKTELASKANTSLDNLSDAGKAVIKDTMSADMALKADKTDLASKANTNLDNLSDAGKTVIKNTLSADMALKADKTDLDSYSKTDASNIDKDKYTAKLGTGEVAENNTELVTGGKVNTAIKMLLMRKRMLENRLMQLWKLK